MTSQNKPGYIMVLTLLIISLSVALIVYIANRSDMFLPYIKTVTNRQKAEMLALGGVQLAVSQLVYTTTGQAEMTDKKQEKKDEEKEARDLFSMLLLVKDRWQTFALTRKRDGIEGSIKICIMSEDGKIDLNQLFDFEKLMLVTDVQKSEQQKKILKELFARIERTAHGKNLLDAFEKFLKERQYKLNDVTELLMIKEFEIFKDKVFFEPASQEKETGKQKNKPIYLTDIFTVWSDKPNVDPWLLSDSLCTVFDLKKSEFSKEDKGRMQEIVKQFKRTSKWPDNWNERIKPLYGKEYAALPENFNLALQTNFDPKVFSVLSYGKVGNITQRLLAIVERRKKAGQDQDDGYAVIIKKMYWL